MKVLIDIPDNLAIPKEMNNNLKDLFSICDGKILDEMTNGEILKEIFSKWYPEMRSVSTPHIMYLDGVETYKDGFKEEWWNTKYGQAQALFDVENGLEFVDMPTAQ